MGETTAESKFAYVEQVATTPYGLVHRDSGALLARLPDSMDDDVIVGRQGHSQGQAHITKADDADLGRRLREGILQIRHVTPGPATGAASQAPWLDHFLSGPKCPG